MEEEAEKSRLKADQLEAEARELQDKIDAAEALPAKIDTDQLTAKIGEAQKIADAIRQWDERERHEAAAKEYSAQSDRLTAAMDERKARRATAIKEAKLPVPGLSVEGKTIMLNGLPLSQAARSEKLRLAIAILVALKPKLRVVLVPDAAVLDDDSMEILERFADEHDFDLWMEVIGDEPGGIIIEDGMVAS